MKKIIFLFALVFLSFPAFSKAMYVPNDALSKTVAIGGAGTTANFTSVPAGQTWTVLQMCMTTSDQTAGVYSFTLNASNNFYYPQTLNQNIFSQCVDTHVVLTAGQTLPYVKPANAIINLSILYVPYALTSQMDTNILLSGIQALLNNIDDKLIILLQIFNNGLFGDFLRYSIVGISAFFIIWFIRFLWRMFFGHL